MAKNRNVISDINLLPLEYREKEKFSLPRMFVTVLIILLFTASAYLYFYLQSEIQIKENEVKNLETQLKAIEKVIQEVKDLEKDREELSQRVDIIESLITKQARLTRVLGDFSETALPEVWLNNLNISANQTFNFSANTFNNYLIALYMNTLKDHGRFDAIELININKQTTKIPEQDRDIDTVNFQLSGVFIPSYRVLSNESNIPVK